jgi:hypothetical protein
MRYLVLVCALELIALRSFFFVGYPAVSHDEQIIAAHWAARHSLPSNARVEGGGRELACR